MAGDPVARRAAIAHPLHELAVRYRRVREATMRLRDGLSAEDCALQSMPDASPVKWHLAHTTWFFETFVLERAVGGYQHFDPQFRMLFNSYYNAVGDRHPRPQRGFISRPGLDEVLDYRAHVDRHMHALLARVDSLPAALRSLIELGIHHEQQHAELILTDLKHLLWHNPRLPAYRDGLHAPPQAAGSDGRWIGIPEGVYENGHDGEGFAFDNESPRHRVFLHAFEIAPRCVTNGEYLAFMEDGGYARPELWLSDGWDALSAHGWRGPLYWRHHDGEWSAFTLHGVRAIDPYEPVCHLSYYEADAYARWAGARLPAEAEWEVVAGAMEIEGNFVESGALHPVRARPAGHGQFYGDVWEWTGSAYLPYRGYAPAAGAIGEYNGKFMCNQFVLRGGSCATPRSHIRATYRNFFPPAARWQFSGLRLARDART